ncbi:MAG: hypothetical protein LIO60_02595, partial [Oscillospiraceae bacterium]|nr:hypothetical protein [Oscillospiraceae bacterium]
MSHPGIKRRMNIALPKQRVIIQLFKQPPDFIGGQSRFMLHNVIFGAARRLDARDYIFLNQPEPVPFPLSRTQKCSKILNESQAFFL